MVVMTPLDLDTLASIPLFSGLSHENLTRLADHLCQQTVPAGRDIMLSEQPGEAVYVVQWGTLKIHAEQPDGRDVVLALLGPGQTVGEMSVVDRQGRSASVTALEESHLLRMDRVTFLDALTTMPALAMNLMRILSSRLRLADATIQSLAAMDIRGRVARQILALAQEYGRVSDDGIHIPLSLTQSDLADIVGASRVRVNQILMEYRQSGYISVDARHHVTIRNREALAERAR
jgi:CRP/FNR family transcriptional regulator, cyclic AMP receptor protein